MSTSRKEASSEEIKRWDDLYRTVIKLEEKWERDIDHEEFTFKQLDDYFELKIPELTRLCDDLSKKEKKKAPKDSLNERDATLCHFFKGIALYFSAYKQHDILLQEEQIANANTYFNTAIALAKASTDKKISFNLGEKFRVYLFELKNFCKEPPSLIRGITLLDGLLDAYRFTSSLGNEEQIFKISKALVIHYWNKRQLPQASFWLSTVLNSRFAFATENLDKIKELREDLKISVGLYELHNLKGFGLEEFNDFQSIFILFLSVNCPNNAGIMSDLSNIFNALITVYHLTKLAESHTLTEQFKKLLDEELLNFDEADICLILKRISFFLDSKATFFGNLIQFWTETRFIEKKQVDTLKKITFKELATFEKPQSDLKEEKVNHHIFSSLMRRKPENKIESNIAYLTIYLQNQSLTETKKISEFNRINDKILKKLKSQKSKAPIELLVLTHFNRGVLNLMNAKKAIDESLALADLEEAFKLIKDDKNSYTVLQKYFLYLTLEHPINPEDKIKTINAVLNVLNVLKKIKRNSLLITFYEDVLKEQCLTDFHGFCKGLSDAFALPDITESQINHLIKVIFLDLKSSKDIFKIGSTVVMTLMSSQFNSPEFLTKVVQHFKDHCIQKKDSKQNVSAQKSIVDHLMTHVNQNNPIALSLAAQIKTHFFTKTKLVKDKHSEEQTSLDKLNKWEQEVKAIKHFLEKNNILEKKLAEDTLDCKTAITQINELFELAPQFGKEKPERYNEIFSNLSAERGKASFLLAYKRNPRDEKMIEGALFDYTEALKIDRPNTLRQKILKQIIKIMKDICIDIDQKEFILQDLEKLIEVVKKSIRNTEATFLDQAFLVLINHYNKIKEPQKALEVAKSANTYLTENLSLQKFSSIDKYFQEQAIQQTKISKYIETVNIAKENCIKLTEESDQLLKIIEEEIKKIQSKINLDCSKSLELIANKLNRMFVIREDVGNKFSFLGQKMKQLEIYELFPFKEKIQEKLTSIEVCSSRVNNHATKIEELSSKMNEARNEVGQLIQKEIEFHNNSLTKAQQTIKKMKAKKSSAIEDTEQASKQIEIAKTARKHIKELTQLKESVSNLDLRSSSEQTRQLKIHILPDHKISGLKRDVQFIKSRTKDQKERTAPPKKENENLKELEQIKQKIKTLNKEVEQLESINDTIKKSLTDTTNQFTKLSNEIGIQHRKIPKNLARELKTTFSTIKECEQLIEQCQTKEMERNLIKEREAKTVQLTEIIDQSNKELKQINLEFKEADLTTLRELSYRTKIIITNINNTYDNYGEACDELRRNILQIKEATDITLDKIKDSINSASKKTTKDTKAVPSPKIIVPNLFKSLFYNSERNKKTLHEVREKKKFTHEWEWFSALTEKLYKNSNRLELESTHFALEIAKQTKIAITNPKKTPTINIHLEFKNDDQHKKIKEILLDFGFKFDDRSSKYDSKIFKCYRKNELGIQKFNLLLTHADQPKKVEKSYLHEPRVAFIPKKQMSDKKNDISDNISAVLINSDNLRSMFLRKKFNTGIPDLKKMEDYTEPSLIDFFDNLFRDNHQCTALFGFSEYDKNAQLALFEEEYIREFFAKRHANMFLKENCYHAVAKLIKQEQPLNFAKTHLKMFLSVILQSHAQVATLGQINLSTYECNTAAAQWMLPFLELVFQEVTDTRIEAILEKLYFAIKFILKSMQLHTIDLGLTPFSDFSCPQNLFYRRFRAALAPGVTPQVLLQNIEMGYEAEFHQHLAAVVSQGIAKQELMLPQPITLPPVLPHSVPGYAFFGLPASRAAPSAGSSQPLMQSTSEHSSSKKRYHSRSS